MAGKFYWKQVLKLACSSILNRKVALASFCSSGVFFSLFDDLKYGKLLTSNFLVHANSVAVQNLSINQQNEKMLQQLNIVGARGRRFAEFASVVVENKLYMTPKDFLESVLNETQKSRFGHKQLSIEEAKEMLSKTPSREENSIDLFRNLNTSGLISYTEYLFLLCVITKPKAGFEIAFKMFDTDENKIVDKTEFLVLGEIFEKRSTKSKDSANKNIKEKETDELPTTLSVHLFGPEGDQVFNYDDFFTFMDNLQTEILELEFLTYSKGMNFISEEDFARILLRFTDSRDTEDSIERLRTKMQSSNSQGISFEEFRSFFQFINNLEDFAIALRLYSLAGKSIGRADFKRAVMVSTGLQLTDNVVNCIYHLFDSDGDDKLSHVEFLGVMKDRLQRGFRRHKAGPSTNVGVEGFKQCVSRQVKIFLHNLATRTQASGAKF